MQMNKNNNHNHNSNNNNNNSNRIEMEVEEVIDWIKKITKEEAIIIKDNNLNLNYNNNNFNRIIKDKITIRIAKEVEENNYRINNKIIIINKK